MATKYALQQQGVMDGTNVPPNKADGREINADKQVILASKLAGTDAWNSGDIVYLGRKPAGRKITSVRLTSDTSLSTSTLSVGIGTDPRASASVTTATKYVNAATHTTPLDKPTVIGPLASTLDDTPPDEEHLWLTIGVTNIAAAVVLTIEIEHVGIDS
jgi:hypothetical protein